VSAIPKRKDKLDAPGSQQKKKKKKKRKQPTRDIARAEAGRKFFFLFIPSKAPMRGGEEEEEEQHASIPSPATASADREKRSRPRVAGESADATVCLWKEWLPNEIACAIMAHLNDGLSDAGGGAVRIRIVQSGDRCDGVVAGGRKEREYDACVGRQGERFLQ
jgi:hypothetical protein